jgi:hypothetical protein
MNLSMQITGLLMTCRWSIYHSSFWRPHILCVDAAYECELPQHTHTERFRFILRNCFSDAAKKPSGVQPRVRDNPHQDARFAPAPYVEVYGRPRR